MNAAKLFQFSPAFFFAFFITELIPNYGRLEISGFLILVLGIVVAAPVLREAVKNMKRWRQLGGGMSLLRSTVF